VPAQQGGGLDQEGAPAPPGEQAAEGPQQGPVGILEAWPSDLAAQDAELVAQDQDLDVFGIGGPEAEHAELPHVAASKVAVK
jgi:hypothetical protein